MNFREEIEKWYTDAHGFVLPKPWSGTPGETQNGLLYTGLYIEILRRTNALRIGDLVKFKEVIASCELQPGLYTRLPGLTNIEQAHDDYIGVAVMGGKIARDICDYGHKNWWSFSVLKQNSFVLKQCFLRHPGVVAYFKQMAGYKLNWLDKLQISIRRMLPADANGKILNFIMFGDTKGLEQAMLEYFGPDHPFTKIAKEL